MIIKSVLTGVNFYKECDPSSKNLLKMVLGQLGTKPMIKVTVTKMKMTVNSALNLKSLKRNQKTPKKVHHSMRNNLEPIHHKKRKAARN